MIDAQGKRLLSRRILNNEAELLQLIADVLELSRDVLWAVDINHGGAALLLGLLVSHDQHITYITGLAIHRASAGYRGQAKTDAKDAFVIADQARMRTDLGVLRPGDEISVDLRTLVTRRTDLVCDRTRQINRLRAQLLEIFPALERSLDLTKKGPVLLLTGYQAPAAIRRAGASPDRGVAEEPQGPQQRGPGPDRRGGRRGPVHRTARRETRGHHGGPSGEGVMALDEEITELEALIEARFREHPHAEVIQSLPGMGTMLSAEFLAATGGDMDTFGTADRLAGYAGLAPVPRDSGRVSGNLHRPRRYHRGLLRAFYLSAFASLRNCPASKQFYERKRAEGRHKQALLALARRRANVLWAMIRDGACYQATPPVTATA
ncbi:IS110 family transposase [Streptomyces sp. RLB1-33]